MAHEDLVADRDFWKKRALAAEQERDEWKAAHDAAEARVAELEAGIKALADEWGRDDLQGVNGSLHGVAGILRALLEKRT